LEDDDCSIATVATARREYECGGGVEERVHTKTTALTASFCKSGQKCKTG